MREHTPMPWALVPFSEYTIHIVPTDHAKRPFGGSIHASDDRDNYRQVIASVGSDRHGRGDKEANARLIAAAPELLAACEVTLANLELIGTHPDTLPMTALRAAISKAKGVAP